MAAKSKSSGLTVDESDPLFGDVLGGGGLNGGLGGASSSKMVQRTRRGASKPKGVTSSGLDDLFDMGPATVSTGLNLDEGDEDEGFGGADPEEGEAAAAAKPDPSTALLDAPPSKPSGVME